MFEAPREGEMEASLSRETPGCLLGSNPENDQKGWRAAVHGVTKSWTPLSAWTTTISGQTGWEFIYLLSLAVGSLQRIRRHFLLFWRGCGLDLLEVFASYAERGGKVSPLSQCSLRQWWSDCRSEVGCLNRGRNSFYLTPGGHLCCWFHMW